MDNNILIVIPTYNEKKNIKELITRIFSLSLPLSVLVVDDSSDHTSNEVRKLKKKHTQLNLIKRRMKKGLGSAYKEGFSYALRKGYDIVIQMDADFSHSPFYIPRMLKLIKKYDLVIGSRYTEGGNICKWPMFRFFFSRSANLLTKNLLRIPIDDLTSGFKCIKTKVLTEIDYYQFRSQGYGFQLEMVYNAYCKDFQIQEMPITFQGRIYEKSKITWKVILEAFFTVWILYMKKLKS